MDDVFFFLLLQAVQIVTSIRINIRESDALTVKDYEHVYYLTYSSHRGVAKAAAAFLSENIMNPDNRDPDQQSTSSIIKDLAQFSIDSKVM